MKVPSDPREIGVPLPKYRTIEIWFYAPDESKNGYKYLAKKQWSHVPCVGEVVRIRIEELKEYVGTVEHVSWQEKDHHQLAVSIIFDDRSEVNGITREDSIK